MNATSEICKSFNQHANTYEQAAIVQQEIGRRLFERLDYLKINPRYVLDLGCGTGVLTAQLKKKYPKALVVGMDLAAVMLVQAKNKQRFWRKWPLVNADMSALPFGDGLFDLVFANQVVHWSDSMDKVFRDVSRVMRQDACFMFSTLGPDTFIELKQAWSSADAYGHANVFVDMHLIGDALLHERFLDPVVDMEYLTVNYSSFSQLITSLRKQGVRNINAQRNKGLTGKAAWQKMERAYQAQCVQEKYPLTYEVVYGHAWKGNSHRQEKSIETRIPLSTIRVK